MSRRLSPITLWSYPHQGQKSSTFKRKPFNLSQIFIHKLSTTIIQH